MSKDEELLIAVQENKIDDVRRLLQEGAKATYFDEDSFDSPIYAAAKNGNTEIFKIILEALDNKLSGSDITHIGNIANNEIQDILYELKEKEPKNIEEQFKANNKAEKKIEDDQWKKRQEAIKNDPNARIPQDRIPDDRMKEAREALEKKGRFAIPQNRINENDRIPDDRMKKAKEALEKNLQPRQNENIKVDPITTSQNFFVPPPPPSMPGGIPTPPPPPMPNTRAETAHTTASQSFTQNQEETARTTQHEQHANPNITQKPTIYEPEQTHSSRPPSYEPEQASEFSEKERLSNIINSLKGLSNNTEIIGGLKQSRKHIEFKEQVKDIIESYNLDSSKVDSNIIKLTTIPMVKAKLKELDKWCEETAKIDNAPIWRNIGNFIKHSLTGNKDKANLYKDAIKNASQNTNNAINIIKESINNPSFSSNVPPPNKNKGERYRG